MYMLRSYATEHWLRAGGEEKNRHAIFGYVLVRRPRLLLLYSNVRV